jgi:hypothetical protein
MIQCILVWWVLKFNLFIICMILYCVHLLLLFVPISTNTLNLFPVTYLEIYYHVHHQVTFQSYWVALTSMCNRIILNDRTLSSSNILQLLETIIETKNINSYYLPLSVLSQHIPVIFPSPTRHVLRCQERTQRGTVAPRKLPLLGDFRITSHGEITYHFIGFSTINHGK